MPGVCDALGAVVAIALVGVVSMLEPGVVDHPYMGLFQSVSGTVPVSVSLSLSLSRPPTPPPHTHSCHSSETESACSPQGSSPLAGTAPSETASGNAEPSCPPCPPCPAETETESETHTAAAVIGAPLEPAVGEAESVCPLRLCLPL